MQNCLVACTFDLLFVYNYSSWEGSVEYLVMFNDACLNNLFIPAGKYFLANAGFPLCQCLSRVCTTI